MKTMLSLLLALATLFLAACGPSADPAALVASAKSYLQKRDYNASIIQLKNALQKEPDNPEARYLLGLASLENGDFATAEVELGKAQQLGLESDELQIALARTLLGRGEADKLLAQFGAKTLSAPKAQAELRALAGAAQLLRNRREEAKAAFDEALAIDPSNVSAALGTARLSASGRDLGGALTRVDAALVLAPTSHEALMLKGQILDAQGREEPAATAYRAAIEAAPAQVAPRLNLIVHLLRQRSLEEAARQVEALDKAAPGDPRSWYAKALVLTQQRKFADAKNAIQQVLKVAPEHVPSLILAGMAALETGAYAEAEGHLRKALFKSPDALGAKRLLAATHLRLGQTDTALAEARDLLAKAGNDPNVLALAAEAALASGDLADAARQYEKAKALLPDNVRLQTRLAQVRFAAGDAGKGFEELEAASASHPDDYQADLALISNHLRHKDADKALEAVQTLEKKQPKNPMTHNLRGLALLMKRDAAGARASFERALELNPLYMPAVANLARLDVRDKKVDAAKRRYEAVLKKEPNNEQALLGLAVLLRVSGAEPAQIEKPLRQSVLANPQSPRSRTALVNHYLRSRDAKAALAAAQDAAAALPNNPQTVQLLGLTQIAANENRQAIATLTRLTEMLPKSPQPHLLLAGAYRAANQPDEAIKSLRAALALQPDLPSAQRDIAALYIATGRAEQALREARSVQAESPKKPLGYVLEGEVYVAEKKWSAAERVYRDAIKKFDLPVLAARAHAVIAASGRTAEADKLAEQWISAHPKDTTVLNYLGERDIAAQRFEAAANRYGDALERAPDNPLLLNNLAWATHQLKRPKALEYAERALELAPDNQAVMDTLGVILVDTGDVERGLELLGRAAELAPQAYRIRLNFAKALVKANRKAAARKELEPLIKLDKRLPVQQEAAKLLSEL